MRISDWSSDVCSSDLKKYFASMTLNDTKIDLGFATFEIILQRIVSKQRSFSDLLETGQVYFAATKEGLATKESNNTPANSAKTENEKLLDELHERIPESRDYIVHAQRSEARRARNES